MKTIKDGILEIISRRMTKIDGSTYEPESIQQIEAAGAYKALQSLRNEIIGMPDGLLCGFGCKKCGGTNFSGAISAAGGFASAKCANCGNQC